MTAPQLEICACHPLDGHIATLAAPLDPQATNQLVTVTHNGRPLTRNVPTNILIVASPDRDGALP